MDYATTVARVYEHLENGHVDKAVMGCLRIARHLKDYVNAAVFLREMFPTKREVARALLDDTEHLKDEARKFLWDVSLDRWLELHTLDFSVGEDENGEERNVLSIGAGEIDTELEQCERAILDLAIPTGMGEFDTAAFADRYVNTKAQLRQRIRAIRTIKERLRARCLNYAIQVERQLEAQQKSLRFLDDVQSEVNNYFKVHSEDVYSKLQKAAQLIDSESDEDLALLLTQVRRAIKASADFFYPATEQIVRCSDGVERQLGDDQYLNRLQEFLSTRVVKSSSKELLRAEFDHLAAFARRLNDLASKGVHANVALQEAKQGLVGLYMFLFNVVSRLQREPAAS